MAQHIGVRHGSIVFGSGSSFATEAPETDAQYWERQLDADEPLRFQAEWLRWSRLQYALWVLRYFSGGTGTVLKTDAFEEARGVEVWQALASRFDRIVTVDVAASVLGAAAGRIRAADRNWMARGEWVQTPVQAMPFRDRSFDGVLSFSTLDHFSSTDEIGQALRELARLTKPGGQLLLTLDNPDNPIIRLRNALPHALLRETGISPYRYGATVGAKQLRAMMTEAGWSVHQMRMVLHAPRVACVAASRYVGDRRVLSRRLFDGFVRGWEWAGHLPTRTLTANFSLAVAQRR